MNCRLATPSIGSRATYELTPLRMLQVMQQSTTCGTRYISHLVAPPQLPKLPAARPNVRASRPDAAGDRKRG